MNASRNRALSAAVLLVSILGAHCGQDAIVTRPRSLGRPTDIAFACVLTDPAGVNIAKPPAVCNGRAQITSTPEGRYRSLGLVTNSQTGEVAVAGLAEETTDDPRALLLDLDTRVPGYNFLPVGRLPMAIESTTDGCRAFVANSGSCDLSQVDVGLVATSVQAGSIAAGAVTRIIPHHAAGAIVARPQALALSPSTLPDGAACNATQTYRAWVAFPSCGLVAELELPSGNYLRGFFVRPGESNAIVDAGTTPMCPAECGPETPNPPDAGIVDAAPADASADAPAPDAAPDAAVDAASDAATDAAADAGTDAAPPGPSAPLPPIDAVSARPWSLALDSGRGRLYLAGTTSRKVWSVALADFSSTNVELTSCVSSVLTAGDPLPCDPRGVVRLRLSPPVTDASRQFLYAVALDSSVRVLGIDVATGALRECETQADPQVVAGRFPTMNVLDPYAAVPAAERYCMPLDEASGFMLPPLRRSVARGPGLRVSGVPSDVAFFSMTNGENGISPEPTVLSGTFAYVVSSLGAVSMFNIESRDNRPRSNIPHQAYNATTDAEVEITTADAVLGGPRLGVGSLRQVIPAEISVPTETLPALAKVGRICPSSQATEFLHFPDLVPNQPETVTFSYEAALPDLGRAAGLVSSLGQSSERMVLTDPGARFCRRGAQVGDLVAIGNCLADEDCPETQRCIGASRTHLGMCLVPRSGSADDVPLARPACEDMAGSRHAFRVREARTGTLIVDERPLVLPIPGGCTSDADCVNVDVVTGTHIFPSTAKFVCDPEPWPGTTTRQCIVACSQPFVDPQGIVQPSDLDCQPDPQLVTGSTLGGLSIAYQGYVCGQTPLGAGSNLRRCVAARIPRTPAYDIAGAPGTGTANDCFVESINYQVRAGLSFVITGERSGYRHNQIDAADGTCVVDTTTSPKLVGRVSYNAPACGPAIVDGYDTGAPIAAGSDACAWGASKPIVSPNPCFRRDMSTGTPIPVWQVATPTFETAIGPANPGVFGSTYSFAFSIQGGYIGMGVRATDNLVTPIALPTGLASIVRFGPGPTVADPKKFGSPSAWLYIVDEGDLISLQRTQLTGQVLRVNPATMVQAPAANTQIQ